MLIKIENIQFFVNRPTEKTNKKPIIFLHGFTGSSLDWNFLINKLPNEFEPIIIDLLGHGQTSSPRDLTKYSFHSQIEFLNKIIEKLNLIKPILVGYSMGGRLALSYFTKYPNSIEAMVLESTSFGLKTENEKKERIESDQILANKITSLTIKEFVDYWMTIPLFNSQKKLSNKILQEQRLNKISTNNIMGLTNSLLGFGTGKMNNYFNLAEKTNILLITGSLDAKFTKIAEEANKLLLSFEHIIVKNAGHNVHLEKPEEFLKFLNSFLLKNTKY